MRLRFLWSFGVLSLSAVLVSAQNPGATILPGFDREGSARERAREKQIDGFLKKDNLKDWMKRLSARPHHLGSPYGKENAEFIAGLFRSWGYETEIERFDVLFPTPKTRLLEMTAPANSRQSSRSRS